MAVSNFVAVGNYMVIDCGRYPFTDIRLLMQTEDRDAAMKECRDQIESYSVRNAEKFCTNKQFKVVVVEVVHELQCLE